MIRALGTTHFVYTGGMERGIRVGLIDYPRFAETPRQIRVIAVDLANQLRRALCQDSHTILMPDETVWDSLVVSQLEIEAP